MSARRDRVIQSGRRNSGISDNDPASTPKSTARNTPTPRPRTVSSIPKPTPRTSLVYETTKSGRHFKYSTSELKEMFKERRLGGSSLESSRESNQKEYLPSGIQFSRPTTSKIIPLRSMFLDPSVNSFPGSKTRTELMKRVRDRNFAHDSYDLDCDGVVDQADMKVGKLLDVDGMGALKPEEKELGKRMLTEKFFQTQSKLKNLHLFNDVYTKQSETDNVKLLANSSAFSELYPKIRLKEISLANRASGTMMSCMELEGEAKEFMCAPKNHYYADKFDATAWNDWGALPRHVMYPNFEEHMGSRNKLIACRRISSRNDCAKIMKDKLRSSMDGYSTKRINLITDFDKYCN